MDCPKCKQAMNFIPANQNWWCNPSLSSVEGEAPTGLAGPSVDQIVNDPKNTPGNPSRASSGGWFDLTDLFDSTLLALLFLGGGGVLMYAGHYVLGGLVIASVIAVGALFD